MKKLLILLAVATFLTAGCAIFSRPTSHDLYNADYGPCPDNHEELIKRFYHIRLFDPYSAVYTFDKFCKGWEWSDFLKIKPRFGWIICGTLNAKNRLGGYIGVSPFYIFIRDGRIINEILAHREDKGALRFVRDRCRSCRMW